MPAKYVALFTFCFAFLVACGGGVTPIPSPAPTATQVVAQITPTNTTPPTATATLPPTNTPSPTVTSTATSTPNLACPAGGQATPFDLPVDETDFQNKVQTFLKEDGTVEELVALAEQLELEVDTAAVDLDGDRVNEWGIYLNFLDKYLPVHLWVVLKCVNNQYQLVYEQMGNWAFHRSFLVKDVDNNQQEELIVISGFAGSACAFEPQVWSWRDDQVVEFSPSYLEIELGCPAELVLEDKDGDNILELILTGDTVGHIDQPPPRGITQTFALTEGSYQLVETVYAPAVSRLELLSDAQRALNKGNLTLASHFYTQAAYDEIGSVGSYYYLHNPEDSPPEYQKAFALFRLMVVQLAAGQEETAGISLTDLQTIYPADVPGHEFAILAQLFYESYAKNQDNTEACLAVTTYIEVHYDSSDQPGLTSHFYWGSSDSSYYQPADLCPVLEPRP